MWGADASTFMALKEMQGVVLIPYVWYIGYFIMLLVWYCKDSQPEANKYGENPKGITE